MCPFCFFSYLILLPHSIQDNCPVSYKTAICQTVTIQVQYRLYSNKLYRNNLHIILTKRYEFFMFSILLYWLSAIGVAALICCCSAFCKRSLSAFVASTVIYAVPYFIRQFGIGGTVVGELMLLFPVCSAKAQQVVRTSEHKMIDLLPVTCEMPIWIAVFTAILIFVLFFLTYRHFSKHQVLG